jgi:hypothetical protein
VALELWLQHHACLSLLQNDRFFSLCEGCVKNSFLPSIWNWGQGPKFWFFYNDWLWVGDDLTSKWLNATKRGEVLQQLWSQKYGKHTKHRKIRKIIFFIADTRCIAKSKSLQQYNVCQWRKKNCRAICRWRIFFTKRCNGEEIFLLNDVSVKNFFSEWYVGKEILSLVIYRQGIFFSSDILVSDIFL